MTALTLDIELLNKWIGKTEDTTDVIGIQPIRAMFALLDHSPNDDLTAPLPPLWHWLFFHSYARQSNLGQDGHSKLGGFLPPVDLPRRMWAGGRLEFFSPLHVGDQVVRTSTIKDISLKNGNSGWLCFVTVEHLLHDGDKTFLREEHDIVYREPAKPGAPTRGAPPAPAAHDVEKTVFPDPIMLFRYSALTFNGHRIHYDRTYCESVEGYPGLVFHGPLTATLLADLAGQMNSSRRMSKFSFRATSPLFDTAPFHICGKEELGFTDLWATSPSGGLAMRAEARFV